MSSPLVAPLDSHFEHSEESNSEMPSKVSSTNLDQESRHDHENSARPNRAQNSSKTPPPTKRNHSKRNLHARSQSHNKIPVRLSTSANPVKPLLNRSRSTDGISRTGRPGIKRNNRSYTKVNGLQPLTKTLLNGSLNRALGALQPLTKTMSNNSLKQYGLKKTTLNSSTKGAPNLTKTNLDQSIRFNKSSGSLRGMNGGSSTSILNTAVGGIKSSAKRGRAILKLNEDAADNDYEDLSEDSEAENDKLEAISNSELQRQFQPSEDPHEAAEGKEAGRESSSERNTEVTDKGDVLVSKLSKIKQLDDIGLKPASSKTSFISNNSSTDDLISKNLYGGSMLLSQSTGLTRKMNTEEPMGYALESELMKNQPESLSGIVFNTRNDETRQNANQAPSRTASGGVSYQPNQTIFSNLQRTNTQFLSDLRQQTNAKSERENQVPNENSKDFSHFLNNSVSGNQSQQNHDTRTQQRLWLQRENSLMDVAANIDPSKLSNFSNLSLNKLMFAHNYNGSTTNMLHINGGDYIQHQSSNTSDNTSPGDSVTPSAGDSSLSVTNLLYLIQSGHQNSIQSRIDFERLNREYVNVRRHLNPVAESLNRVETYQNPSKGIELRKQRNKKAAIAQNKNANSFKEFAPKWEEKQEDISGTIGRLWLEALLTSSSSGISLQLLKHEQQNQPQATAQQMYHQLLQNQQQQQEQLRAYRHNIATTPNRTMAPTTRAVKAAQAAAASTLQR
ncbi:CIC11C00000001996 [Sungouiella intermedia]|uniref:CIC11C00000001996 n=1 Tax=Sungouiella intermedia TaxID=45354 RepID=A0A1L0DYD5_9ASCO|nr:CIC11C00000001996 [[Candida] intermedia]